MTKTPEYRDFILVDFTNVWWPGRLPVRSQDTRRGRGYLTYEAAQTRLRRVVAHYNGKFGQGPGDLRVVGRN